MNLNSFATAVVAAHAMSTTATITDYPELPIAMVIPYGAGGATDISARSISVPLG